MQRSLRQGGSIRTSVIRGIAILMILSRIVAAESAPPSAAQTSAAPSRAIPSKSAAGQWSSGGQRSVSPNSTHNADRRIQDMTHHAQRIVRTAYSESDPDTDLSSETTTDQDSDAGVIGVQEAGAVFASAADITLTPVPDTSDSSGTDTAQSPDDGVIQTVAAGPQENFLDLSTSALESLPKENATGVPEFDQVRILAWALIILCGCCLAVLAGRKWQRTRGLLPATAKGSRVLETLSLGPGRTVSLIEISGLRALVGSDAGGIRTIVLAPPSFADQIEEFDSEEIPASRV